MDRLAQATLSAPERRALARLVSGLEAELGADLRGVWLYGSRARAAQVGDDSDIDLLVVSSRPGAVDSLRANELAVEASLAEGVNPFTLSVKVYDAALVDQRRAIQSFFMQEVDRDKIVLAGEP
jgi:predicted nucleotidyltransferase